jgi:hypothetical protein
MSKARDLANAGTALTTVSATELGYLDGVTSAVQTQINAKEATLPSQTGNTGKYLTTDGSAKSWGTVSQYALPSQTGNSGKYLTTNGTAESWGTVSAPIKWTRRLAATGTNFNSVAYNGTNLWVAVGGNGQLYSSPDAITWTSRTSQFSTTEIKHIAFGNGLWVAVGAAGKISTSTDGTTWTARTSNMSTNDINHVIYDNSIWVAVGGGGGSTNTGGITYSTDGTTWTRKSQSLTIGTTYRQALWNGTNWIVAAGTPTNNYLYATTPSGTWTAAAHSGGYDINCILSDGTRTIFNKGDASFYTTTATTLTSTTALSSDLAGTSQPYEIKAYDGYVYRLYSGYLHIFTLTTGSSTVQNENFYLLPTSFTNSGGTLQNTANSLVVSAAGIVIVSARGGIHTSF